MGSILVCDYELEPGFFGGGSWGTNLIDKADLQSDLYLWGLREILFIATDRRPPKNAASSIFSICIIIIIIIIIIITTVLEQRTWEQTKWASVIVDERERERERERESLDTRWASRNRRKILFLVIVGTVKKNEVEVIMLMKKRTKKEKCRQRLFAYVSRAQGYSIGFVFFT